MHKTVRRHVVRWVGIAGVSLLSGACSGQDEAQRAVAERQADASAVEVSVALASQADATVDVTLTNRGSHAVRLLRWWTPAEGVEEDLFEVYRDGERVPFVGPHYKRPAATEADYVRLAPGESLTRTVSLAAVYDLSRDGKYTVRWNAEATGLGRAAGEASALFAGRTSGAALADAGDEPAVAADGTLSFSGRCDATQQNTIRQSITAATNYATESSNKVAGMTTSTVTARYTTWFGTPTSARLSRVQSNFRNIADAFVNANITVDCKCKQNYYAYVYPTQPYKIYVCRAYWSAPMTGTDSKAGTMVHEMSHFNVVAGTDDHVYGQSGAKNLAITSPDQAVDNADSHEYFAENTPFQN